MAKTSEALDLARANGEKFYFTGLPCKHGHIALRRVDNRGCVECHPLIDRRSYVKHQEKRVAKARRWERENPDRAAKLRKEAVESGRRAIWEKKSKRKNRESINASRRSSCENDVSFRLRLNLSNRINNAVRFQWGHKSSFTAQLLGCSIEELRAHLESLFLPGMSWGNYGYGADKWHIDHIKPCALFDLTDSEQQKACFHFSNLQPLWQTDNLRKNKRFRDGVIHCRA
jgi:hypothetical protein